jgi:hypothetical protein
MMRSGLIQCRDGFPSRVSDHSIRHLSHFPFNAVPALYSTALKVCPAGIPG